MAQLRRQPSADSTGALPLVDSPQIGVIPAEAAEYHARQPQSAAQRPGQKLWRGAIRRSPVELRQI